MTDEQRLMVGIVQLKRERDESRQRVALLEQRLAELVDAVRLGRLDEVERIAEKVLQDEDCTHAHRIN